MKTILVVPTIRQEGIESFLSKSLGELNRFDEIFVIWDGAHVPELRFPPPETLLPRVRVFDHTNMDRGGMGWIWSRKSSACRSFGFLEAYFRGADVIFTCDDDVELPPYWWENHLKNLDKSHRVPMWSYTLGNTPTRGYPYTGTNVEMETVLSHGLWNSVADWDAMQQLSKGRGTGGLAPNTDYVQQAIFGGYFPMCGMNLAFKAKLAPLMYFGLQGQDSPYDRFDDIWCGVVLQRIARRFNWILWSGDPIVKHLRASDPMKNLVKEVPGIQMNEYFWRWVQDTRLVGKRPIDCFHEIAAAISMRGNGDYWTKLANAMRAYSGIFHDCDEVLDVADVAD